MLEPVAAAYSDLGVPSRYRPINDVVTAEGRKISGTGAATVGDYLILVGNLIADFDYETMARVLRVPDEKYRDKVFKSMRENLTTLKRELGRTPEWDEMVAPLLSRFREVLGHLEPAPLPHAVYDEMESLKPRYLSEDWLYKKGRRIAMREVKIATGVNVVNRLHKAPGGLIRATFEVKEGRLGEVSLSGDFFCYPAGAIAELESLLEGAASEQIPGILADIYLAGRIETPGVTPEDWLRVLSV
jgi:lipoate-protein ligase A